MEKRLSDKQRNALNVENSEKRGIIKEKDIFNSKADPMYEVTGSA